MSYSAQSVSEAVEASSIGGGQAYDGKLNPSTADIEVSSADGLLSALDSSNDTIAIANDAVIDLTGENQIDLGSKTLVSYRGWNGQEGALIQTDSRGYYGRRPYTLFDSAGSPRVTGLRIRGARYQGGFTRWDYDDNLAQAIRLRGSGGEIDNCEFFGWTWNAIHLKGGESENAVTEAAVHHNHIHKSYQLGYGYGINIRRGFGEIHHNYFDETRHAVAGYGWWNSGFVVENNVFGPRQYSHTVDMHSLEENKATTRVGDEPDHPNYDLRAGGTMRVQNNTFCMDQGLHGGGINAVAIRGVPWDGVWIENNRFAHPQRPPYNSGNDQEGFAWRQVNLNLSSWDPIPQDDEGYTLNWNDSNNQFGAPETPWESGYGAPVDLTNGGGGGETIFTVNGGGSRSYYTFSVDGNVEKSEEYGGTINPNDEIIIYESDELDTIVAGWTTNEPDSYVIDGEITSFSGTASPEVSMNGNGVDPAQFGETVITISGRGSSANYEFEFAGNVEKSTAYGASIDSNDEVLDSRVEGTVSSDSDSFVFEGEITGFSTDSSLDVLFNGQPTGIWIESEEQEQEDEDNGRNVVTIDGQGSTVYYTFSVDGDIEKSDANGATISDSDSIIPYEEFDTIVTGRTTNESDSFVFDGEIKSFSTSSTGSPAQILVNDEEVDSDDFDETIITIAGRGSTARYEFEFRVDGDVEKSTAYGATINSYDQIDGSAVSGRTTNEPDSFVFSGALTEFSADEAVDVSFNGQATGIWI